MSTIRISGLCRALFAALAIVLAPTASEAAPVAGNSELVTWSCTGAPCPWGAELSGQALVWPNPQDAQNNRFGYSVSKAIYLAADKANGLTFVVQAGTASLYAGLPDALSHRALATVSQGSTYVIQGLQPGEVVSVQAQDAFAYTLASADPSQPVPVSSSLVSWTCATAPCPWGPSLEGYAAVWPAAASPQQQRLGYVASAGIYLPSTYANGMELEALSGSASAYAGTPGAESHRLLATLVPGGGRYTVAGLAAGEVLSVQSGSVFTFDSKRADPSAPPTNPPPTDPPPTDPPPPSGTNTSLYVVWSCSAGPCPWGTPLTGQALAWPSDWAASSSRLGYETSAGVYLDAATAADKYVTVLSGSASAYAGLPGAESHRLLGVMGPGQTIALAGLQAGEVVSVQSSDVFTYTFTPGGTPTDPPPTPPDADVIQSTMAYWRCNIPECQDTDWTGGVVNWPSWAAYENNARTGTNSRSVFGSGGEQLYPYMGAWAQGCEVTAVSGTVLIIEWLRGTDTWRETYLQPGQTHVIGLVAPENGALIESVDSWSSFSVRLNNCTPQQIR